MMYFYKNCTAKKKVIGKNVGRTFGDDGDCIAGVTCVALSALDIGSNFQVKVCPTLLGSQSEPEPLPVAGIRRR